MKRFILLLVILLIAAFATWKLFFNKPEDKPAPAKDKPLNISKNSNAFTDSFTVMMNTYYALRDALVTWDTLAADQQALLLQRHADSLPIKQIQADSSIVLNAVNLSGSISNEVKGFIGEPSIEQKRREFNMITEELYNLIRNVQYDGQIVYHMRCPMAFNENEEGYWLSNTSHIVNPYLGNNHPKYKGKMIGCGEVVDSLNFSKK